MGWAGWSSAARQPPPLLSTPCPRRDPSTGATLARACRQRQGRRRARWSRLACAWGGCEVVWAGGFVGGALRALHDPTRPWDGSPLLHALPLGGLVGGFVERLLRPIVDLGALAARGGACVMGCGAGRARRASGSDSPAHRPERRAGTCTTGRRNAAARAAARSCARASAASRFAASWAPARACAAAPTPNAWSLHSLAHCLTTRPRSYSLSAASQERFTRSGASAGREVATMCAIEAKFKLIHRLPTRRAEPVCVRAHAAGEKGAGT